MKISITRRLTALFLVVALAAPAAWAAPMRLGVGWWAVAWGWLADLWAKDGPGADTDGRASAPTGDGAGDLPSDGPALDPNGCGIGDCTNDGPALDPAGRGLGDCTEDGPLGDPDGKR